MGLISIKDYAASNNKTQQAVYQQIKRKEKSGALEGHIQVINGIKYLDEEAVRILQAGTETSPTVVISVNKDQVIEEQENEIKRLILEKDRALEKYTEILEWKVEQASAIAQVEQQRLALQEKIDAAVQAKEDEVTLQLGQKYRREIQDLQAQLDQERTRQLTWKERLLGRKEGQ